MKLDKLEYEDKICSILLLVNCDEGDILQEFYEIIRTDIASGMFFHNWSNKPDKPLKQIKGRKYKYTKFREVINDLVLELVINTDCAYLKMKKFENTDTTKLYSHCQNVLNQILQRDFIFRPYLKTLNSDWIIELFKEIKIKNNLPIILLDKYRKKVYINIENITEFKNNDFLAKLPGLEYEMQGRELKINKIKEDQLGDLPDYLYFMICEANRNKGA